MLRGFRVSCSVFRTWASSGSSKGLGFRVLGFRVSGPI